MTSGNRTRLNERPVWKMANRMCNGQLLEILKFERARGESYDSISKFLDRTYGVELTKNTIGRWCTQIAEIEELEAKRERDAEVN